MKPTLTRIGIITGLALAAMSLRLGMPRVFAHEDKGHDSTHFVYSAKVLCPSSGAVTTTINVHNPDKKTQTLSKEGIALDVGQVPTAPGTPVMDTLNSDWALQMGCADLTTLGAVGPAGFGDVVLESPRELDVWAVYLTNTPGSGEASATITGTEVVRVPASRHQGAGEGD
jgi:hypothetical protein